MNRRNFFSALALGVTVAPLALLAQPPERRRVARHVADIPPEAGKVNCMALSKDHVFVGCDNGVWMIETEGGK